MELQARKLEGFVHSFTASTFNFCGCFRRKVLGLLALAALLLAANSVPMAAQSVQFFGGFRSYNQTFALNAQGLVANAQGAIYVSGSHALGYVPVDVNGVPIESGEVSVPGYPSQGAVMGMAIDAGNNIFRADPGSPNGPAVEMFTYLGSPTSFSFSYIGSGWIAPSSVTVDSLSNVYVLDAGIGAIVKLAPIDGGGYTQTTVIADPALLNTTGLSIDSSGDFFVASGPDYGYTNLDAPAMTTVYKLINNGDTSYTITPIGSGWNSPSATSVDAAGNVWVVDFGAGTIDLLVPTGGGSYSQSVYQNIPNIRTLMVNRAGRIYGFGYSNSGGDAVIWTGGTPPHNLGTYNVGTAAPTVTMTVDFMSPATAGRFNVTTQGASKGEFQAHSSTCAPGDYIASQSCTVDVTFTPTAPGMRTGALVVTDGSGNVLGTNYFYGIGLAPSIAYGPGTRSIVIPNTSGVASPFGTALDAAGNLYVTDWRVNTLSKLAMGSTTPTVLDSSLDEPLGTTVDGAGNLWVAEWAKGDIVLETLTGPGTYVKSVPFSGLASPYGVALDGSGNLYIAEFGTGDVLKETLTNGTYSQSVVVSHLKIPNSVAVDSSGNVYVTDTGNNQVLEETPIGNSYVQTIVADSGLNQPEGLAIDPNGNVYIGDSLNDRIVKATPAGATFVQSTFLAMGMAQPVGLALDAAGDLYIADQMNGLIDELNVSTAPLFNFANTVVGSASLPQSTTILNYGNATLNISTISLPAAFPSSTSTCALSSQTLAANTSCVLGIDFMPTSGVPYSDAVVITDNHLNIPATTQTITVSGTGLSDVTLSPASETLPDGTVGVGYLQSFSADGGALPYTYAVTITSGTMPAGLSFNGGVLSGTPSAGGSVTFSIVATDSNSYASNSQSYSLTIAAAPAVISISPALLPDGAVGIPYNQAITASGGSGSYAYAVTSGSLPAWLSLNASSGLLSGTPIVGGAIGFTITATDTSASVTASQSYAPTIYAVASAAARQDAGSSNIGSPALTSTLTFTFNVPSAVASLNVVTQGVANKDFTNTGSGTCTAPHAYSATDTCTVDVTFTPQAAGLRYGAVLLEDASGNVLGTGYVSGVGTGPQITFQPGTESTVANAAAPFNLAGPAGVAVDAAGNVYIADYTNGAVYKETFLAGSYTQSTIATLSYVTGVALDGAGNVYIAQGPNSTVYKETPSGNSYTQSVISSNAGVPTGLAVDGGGNVFVVDGYGNKIYELALSAGSYSQSTVISSDLSTPVGIAVDASDNLYIADQNNHQVWKETLVDGSYIPSAIASGLSSPDGVSLDGSGNVYIVDPSAGKVLKETLNGGGYTQTEVPTGHQMIPTALAIDSSGNLFLVDANNRRVVREDYADQPSLTFANATSVGSADTEAPLTVTLLNIGNTPLSFLVPGTGMNPAIGNSSFTLDNSSSCPKIGAGGVAGGLAVGASCTYAVDFTPQAAGVNSGALTVYDDHLNNASAAQSIVLLGTGVVPVITVSPVAGTLTAGTVGLVYSRSFTASGGSGPYTFASSGTLPDGLLLSVGGVLAGTPTTAGGPWSFSVTATDTLSGGQVSQGYTLSIEQGTATITLSGLSQTYTGSPLVVTATTSPAGLTVSQSYSQNGSSVAEPTSAGSYVVTATITDPNYQGAASGTMIIIKGAAAVSLSGLSRTYTGSPLATTATTNPVGLNVSLTYNGSSTAPTVAGSYAVVGTINDTNYQGAASGTMLISKAAAKVTLSGLSQTYTGSPLEVTVTTNPARLSVSLTYNGSSTAPTAAGSYAVVGTINDTNYTGMASGTLLISAAASLISVAASANPVALMGFSTLTATVSSTAGSPGGQVSFLDGTNPLGSAAVSGGVATFTTASLTAGAHSITAIYVASANFAAASSSPLALTVVDLAVGKTDGIGGGSLGQSQTTTPGGTASYTVPLAPSVGTTFPSPIILFVTGLPVGATTTLGTPGWTKQSPTMWTLPANQPVGNILLTFQMPMQMAASEPSQAPARKLPLVAVALLLLPFARKWRKASKRMNQWLCLLLIAAGMTAVTATTGCGSSSTPLQTYNMTVTVTSGALTHSTPLTLTVK